MRKRAKETCKTFNAQMCMPSHAAVDLFLRLSASCNLCQLELGWIEHGL